MVLMENLAAGLPPLPFQERVRAEWSSPPRTAFLCVALGCITQLHPGIWLWLLDHKQGRRTLASVSFVGSVLAVTSVIHASPLHVPHNQCFASPLPFLLFRSFSPSFCSSSFWFCSLHSLMPQCLSWFSSSCFSSSDSYLSCLPYPFLFSLSLLSTPPSSFVFLFKMKKQQQPNPSVHLTVQTERSDGVAAGSGARGRAGAPAPPSRTGAAPPSRWGCQELPPGRPELFQSRG